MSGSSERALETWLQTLHVSPFYTFGWLRAPHLLVLRRSAVRYPELATVSMETTQLIAALPSERTKRLLVDMRLAPPTNDVAFENAMQRLRLAIAKRVERAVLLVATATGAMQVARLQRTERTTFYVTRDEQEAFRFARDA